MKNRKWHSTSIYVDHETGDVLPKDVALKNYTILKKEKYVTTTDTTGHIEYINICQLRTELQGKLF